MIVNKTSFASIADADTYLLAGNRSGAWEFVETADKQKALVSATRIAQKQSWQGSKAALKCCTAAVIAGGGTGYAVNDVLTVVGGTTDVATTLTVSAVSSGVITSVTITDAGLYTTEPTNDVSVTGGGGSGATFTLTFATQSLPFPRTDMTDREGESVGETTVPETFLNGIYELAYDISQDSSAETAGNKRQSEKRLKAGSAEIEFFADDPGAAIDRFEPYIQEWWDEWLASNAPIPTDSSGSLASGTDVCSHFDDGDTYKRNEGFF